MDQVISALDSYAYRPMVWDVFVQRIVRPEEGGQSDERVVSGALRPIGVVLDQLDLWIGGNKFLTGRSMTLADLHGFPMLLYFAQTPEGMTMLDAHPRVSKWLDRMKERASVKATRSLRG